MRKVIASEFVSLDGVVEAPDRWQFPYSNDEMGEAVGAEMAQADAMLLGRVTYESLHLIGRLLPTSRSQATSTTRPSSSSRGPWKSPSSGRTRR